MAASAARIDANRRNSLKSTGPKSPEGKAASRINAFKHGMAGGGDLVGPGDDARLVAERAGTYARELNAAGGMGSLLAHRVALLSVRLERLATDELAAVGAAERQALADFDAARRADIDELIAEAEAEAETADGDPTAALVALAGCPDGLGRLLAAWRDLRARLAADDPGDAPARAARWLGLAGEGSVLIPADLLPRVDAELARLRALAATMGPAERAIRRDRLDAGRLARFDPSPEATLARRYEAATERGLFRTLRAIADLNRQGAAVPTGSTLPVAAPPRDLPPSFPRPRDPFQGAPPRPAVAPLASFRAGVAEPLASCRAGVDPAPVEPTRPDPASPEPRQPRPSRRQLDRLLAATRR